METWTQPELWFCWLGDRQGIRPVKLLSQLFWRVYFWRLANKNAVYVCACVCVCVWIINVAHEVCRAWLLPFVSNLMKHSDGIWAAVHKESWLACHDDVTVVMTSLWMSLLCCDWLSVVEVSRGREVMTQWSRYERCLCECSLFTCVQYIVLVICDHWWSVLTHCCIHTSQPVSHSPRCCRNNCWLICCDRALSSRLFQGGVWNCQGGTIEWVEAENWRTVNFLPKCTRLHQIASQISKFSRGWHPWTPIPGEGDTPSPDSSPSYWRHQIALFCSQVQIILPLRGGITQNVW